MLEPKKVWNLRHPSEHEWVKTQNYRHLKKAYCPHRGHLLWWLWRGGLPDLWHLSNRVVSLNWLRLFSLLVPFWQLIRPILVALVQSSPYRSARLFGAYLGCHWLPRRLKIPPLGVEAGLCLWIASFQSCQFHPLRWTAAWDPRLGWSRHGRLSHMRAPRLRRLYQQWIAWRQIRDLSLRCFCSFLKVDIIFCVSINVDWAYVVFYLKFYLL